jgi:hypothetical protein
MSNKVPPTRQPVLWYSICQTKYPLPVNQFCSHQYVEQCTPSPSTSSVVINMSYWCLQNWLTGRGYFARHIDDYRTGWWGGGYLFDILMTTELVDGEGVLCSTYWCLQNWLTGRRYFVRHIDDYRTGWLGGGILFDISMTTELGRTTYPPSVNQFCRHQYVEQSTPPCQPLL